MGIFGKLLEILVSHKFLVIRLVCQYRIYICIYFLFFLKLKVSFLGQSIVDSHSQLLKNGCFRLVSSLTYQPKVFGMRLKNPVILQTGPLKLTYWGLYAVTVEGTTTANAHRLQESVRKYQKVVIEELNVAQSCLFYLFYQGSPLDCLTTLPITKRKCDGPS